MKSSRTVKERTTKNPIKKEEALKPSTKPKSNEDRFSDSEESSLKENYLDDYSTDESENEFMRGKAYVSVPEDENRLSGFMQLSQNGKILGRTDEIFPHRPIEHEIKLSEPNEIDLNDCDSVTTDWAVEPEPPFAEKITWKGPVIREVLPGTKFIHCYDDDPDLLVSAIHVRAHLVATQTGKEYHGYFERLYVFSSPEGDELKEFSSQMLAKCRAKSKAATEPTTSESRSEKRAGDSSMTSLEKAGPKKKPTQPKPNSKKSNSARATPTSSGRPKSNQIGSKRESLKADTMNTKKIVKNPKPSTSQMPKTQKPSSEKSNTTNTKKPKVKIPDAKNVPSAVKSIKNEIDFQANRKVVEYIRQLEEAEKDIFQRFEKNEEVTPDELDALDKAKDAILKKYGYDLTDPGEELKKKKRQRRKNAFPSGVSVSSSESEDSERELKAEITKRFLQNTEYCEIKELKKFSKQWQAKCKGSMQK